MQNGYTKSFCCDKIKNALQIRTRRPGDVIYVSRMGGHKKLKDYFIDIKLPRHERDAVPVLADGKDVLWIMDDKSIVSDAYQITRNASENIVTLQMRKGNHAHA